jgi:hypothetical protein
LRRIDSSSAAVFSTARSRRYDCATVEDPTSSASSFARQFRTSDGVMSTRSTRPSSGLMWSRSSRRYLSAVRLANGRSAIHFDA